jgi:hypothetical protein
MSLAQLKSSFKQLTDSGSESVGVKGRVQQEMHGGDERENQNMQLLHSLLSSHSRFIHGALRWVRVEVTPFRPSSSPDP